MQADLQIAIVQKDLVWQDAEKNRKKLDALFASLNDVDVIVLPEMFTTGFSMHPKPIAETMDGASVSWLKEKARMLHIAIVGSIIIKEQENYYNRLLFVYPNGTIESYDKRHAFTLAGENEKYATGNEKLIVSYKGWKICPLICYDLRFPVWSRNTENYDVLLYVANWPKPRIHAWNTLLKARAIENMCYCIGANRVGVDANGHEYSGNSVAIDFLGNEMTALCENKEAVLYTTLVKNDLQHIRAKLPFLEDKDEFAIITDDA
ncbi:MAG: amidohydrolase [Flavobacteriaceae bacterium]|nr:amidohydrolase [Flavobacteriaceae bacterium]